MTIKLLLVGAFCCFAAALHAEEPKPAATVTPHTNAPIEFDSFIVVLLVRAPNAPDMPKAQLDELQEKHIANIHRLADEGKLLKAGPMEDLSGRNVRGMYILKTDSLDQAREWVATDPTVKAGRLAPEFLKWSVPKGSLK
ncbi:MAG TPA: YciI family protein [Chthoniobacterales bacterium]|nr:YciI family protein [Chthoniobacterales bacterium]